MKHNILIVIFFVSTLAHAESELVLKFFFNTTPLTIYKYEQARVSSSLRCKKLTDGILCDELSFLNDLKKYKLKTKLEGGKTVGSAVCNEKLEGTIVIAKTSLGDENAFCKLKNSIYVELGTLGYYLDLK